MSEKLDVVEGANRLFRAYLSHCTRPDLDTLHFTLNALHSLNDRLSKNSGANFHKFDEFVALKALRNLTHHAEEVRNNVRVVPAKGMSELLFMCILRRDQVERAIQGTVEKWRDNTKAACNRTFYWYGPAVDINPCLFNFMVHAYEILAKSDIRPTGDAFEQFEDSYLIEEEDGRPHFVSGQIAAKAGEIGTILAGVVAELPPAENL